MGWAGTDQRLLLRGRGEAIQALAQQWATARKGSGLISQEDRQRLGPGIRRASPARLSALCRNTENSEGGPETAAKGPQAAGFAQMMGLRRGTWGWEGRAGPRSLLRGVRQFVG